MEKELLILVVYLNIDGMSRNSSENYMHDVYQAITTEYEKTNKDVKIHVFPVSNGQETKVECVYPPPPFSSDKDVFENELLKIYKLVLNAKNSEAEDVIRNIERRLKINKIKNK